MKISTFHFLTLESPKNWSEHDLFDYELQCVDFAEELGFDGVWLAEHHFRPNVCPSTLAFAAHIAARTSRIRIGLGVLVLPLYNPLRLAEEVAVVDHLSRGRLNLGLGRGYNRDCPTRHALELYLVVPPRPPPENPSSLDPPLKVDFLCKAGRRLPIGWESPTI